MFYKTPVFYVFVMGLTAFVLMMLITFSIPLVSSFYFLYSSEARGVRFGLWGWCLDEYEICSGPLKLGYTWEPQISNPITKALVLYPITAVLIILTMISLIPVGCARTARADRVFVIFAWISFIFSAIALFFMFGMWGIAKSRFEQRGFSASYGPLPWLSVTATMLLLAIALSPFVFGPPPKVEAPKTLRRVGNLNQTDLEALSGSRRKHRQHSSQRSNQRSLLRAVH